MKILLICQGGMSTSYLMHKMKKYADSNGIELEVNATSINEYLEEAPNYDVLLVGPQASYRLDEIANDSGKPTGGISPADYGIGNVENIMKQAHQLLGK